MGTLTKLRNERIPIIRPHDRLTGAGSATFRDIENPPHDRLLENDIDIRDGLNTMENEIVGVRENIAGKSSATSTVVSNLQFILRGRSLNNTPYSGWTLGTSGGANLTISAGEGRCGGALQATSLTSTLSLSAAPANRRLWITATKGAGGAPTFAFENAGVSGVGIPNNTGFVPGGNKAYIGQCDWDGTVITNILSYRANGLYTNGSAGTTVTNGLGVTLEHNLGFNPLWVPWVVVNLVESSTAAWWIALRTTSAKEIGVVLKNVSTTSISLQAGTDFAQVRSDDAGVAQAGDYKTSITAHLMIKRLR